MIVGYDNAGKETISWAIGQSVPTSMRNIMKTALVVASKDELSWLINSFVNIPHHRTEDPQIWTGDFARFIVSHLPASERNKNDRE